MRLLFYKILTSKVLRFLFMIAIVMFMSGCDKDSDRSAGADKNFEEQAKCWQTTIIHAVLEHLNDLFQNSSSSVTNGGPAVIALGFAIWMAFKLLKVLPSFKEENLGEVWTEIGQKLFVCGFCAIIVSNTSSIVEAMNTFVVPIYNTVLEVGAEIIGQRKNPVTVDLGDYGSVTFGGNYNQCSTSGINANNLSGSIEPMANCLVCQISDRLNSGVKIGIELISSLDLGAMLVGIVMMLIFGAAKLFFIFFIVDGLFRLNFAAFLIPVLIVGIPFNFTRKWSLHGFLMFINSAGVMLFLGILISIAIGGLEYLLKAYSANGVFTEENFVGQGPVLLSLLMISTLLINIPGLGVALSDKFIGGGGDLEFQKKISGFVVNTAKRAGAAALGWITGGASHALTSTIERYEVTREALDTVKQLKSHANEKLNSLAGYKDD